MPLYERCPRCGLTGLHAHVNYPEAGACIHCGHVEYLGGIGRTKEGFGDQGADVLQEPAMRRARRDMEALRPEWEKVTRW